LAFPIVNENEIEQKAKEENERAWKTKSGFDNVMKRENWNEHPKKPDQSTIDNLKMPHYLQALETKKRMQGFAFVPGENGKPDFQAKVKSQRPTFSKKEYFNTVFISGDDMVKEMAEQKQREIDEFNKKVVVDNKHFYVNTMEKKKVAQVDRFKNIREDDVKKIGIRFGKKRLQELAERQILATQTVDPAPVSMLKNEEYKLMGYRPPYKPFEPEKSIVQKDFDTNIPKNFREKSPLSRKVFIKEVGPQEKTSAVWGATVN